MLEYPIIVYEPKCWTVYVHVVPKEIRSSPDSDDYYDKYYVGITSKSVKQRWGKDGHNYMGQIFGNSIRKYGWNNIHHFIVIENITMLFACEFEKFLIKHLKSFIRYGHGYNGTTGGEGATSRNGELNSFYGKKHTDESRKKMSEHHYDCSGVNNPMFGIKLSKEEALKRASNRIYKNGKDNPRFGIKVSEETKIKMSESRSVPVIQKDIYGNIIRKYKNMTEVEQYGFSHGSVSLACRNNKPYKNYLWEYENPNYKPRKQPKNVGKCKSVVMIDDNGVKTKFISVREAARQMNTCPSNIRNVCNGKQKTAAGYKWEWGE